jgi:hypothetical protein
MTNKTVIADLVFSCSDPVQQLPAAILKNGKKLSKSEILMMIKNDTLSINQ